MKFVQTSSTLETVVAELRKELQTQATEWFRVLRNDDVVAPTTEELLLYHKGKYFRFHRPKTWREFLRLSLVHWYLPKDFSVLINLELHQLENQFGTDKRIQAHCILKSEPEMIGYLMETSGIYKTERELFGDIHSKFSFEKYHFKSFDPRKPKKKVYRRGYNDQGSRRLPHEQHEAKFDFSFTEQQNQKEERDKELNDTIQLIEGWLQ